MKTLEKGVASTQLEICSDGFRQTDRRTDRYIERHRQTSRHTQASTGTHLQTNTHFVQCNYSVAIPTICNN